MSRLGWRSIKSCSLASEKKLPNFPVKMLRELCENLGLNVDGTYRSLICLPSLLGKGHVHVNDTCQNYNNNNNNYYYYYYYYYSQLFCKRPLLVHDKVVAYGRWSLTGKINILSLILD